MFEQTFVGTRVEARTPAALAVSLCVQSVAIGGLLLLPLLNIELLPLKKMESPMVWMVQLRPPEPPPPVAPRQTRRAPRMLDGNTLNRLLTVPRTIDMNSDPPEPQEISMPLLTSMTESVINFVAPPAPPPPPAVARVDAPRVMKPVAVSQGVQAARLVFGPKPQYPALARTARVQGTVRLHATIGADGGVRNLQVVSGPPLLVNSAVEAVSRWRYQPTLLTGVPVEVTTEIEVNFTLSQ